MLWGYSYIMGPVLREALFPYLLVGLLVVCFHRLRPRTLSLGALGLSNYYMDWQEQKPLRSSKK